MISGVTTNSTCRVMEGERQGLVLQPEGARKAVFSKAAIVLRNCRFRHFFLVRALLSVERR